MIRVFSCRSSEFCRLVTAHRVGTFERLSPVFLCSESLYSSTAPWRLVGPMHVLPGSCSKRSPHIVHFYCLNTHHPIHLCSGMNMLSNGRYVKRPPNPDHLAGRLSGFGTKSGVLIGAVATLEVRGKWGSIRCWGLLNIQYQI